MKTVELLIDLPFLKKGKIFVMDEDTGHVYGADEHGPMEYPLRNGLASYLWLLATEEGYLKTLRIER